MARPTVGTVSGEQSTSGVTITVDATARALMLVLMRGSNTSSNHDDGGSDITVSIGGKSLGLQQNCTIVQLHQCLWAITDYAAFRSRTSNTVTIASTTLGTGINQYRWRAFPLLHPTHTIVLASSNLDAENANGGTCVCTLNPGASVQARAVMAINCSNGSGGAGSTTGLTSGTDHYANVAGPTGTAHEKWGSSGEITGSTSVGYNIGAGSNTQRTLVAAAFIEGTPLPKAQGGQVWALGALPAILTRALPLGLVGAAALPDRLRAA